MKHLMLLRHAKSDWYSDSKTDFDRPLNKRGVDDASIMAGIVQQQILDNGCNVDCAIISSAKRTRQTFNIINNTLQLSSEKLTYSDDFYLISIQSLLMNIISMPDDVNNLLLIGHNPALEELLFGLCPNAPILPTGKLMTTCNFALITVDSSWSDIDSSNCELISLLRPKEIKSL